MRVLKPYDCGCMVYHGCVSGEELANKIPNTHHLSKLSTFVIWISPSVVYVLNKYVVKWCWNICLSIGESPPHWMSQSVLWLCKDCHYKSVSPSYLYNVNPNTRKDGLYMKAGSSSVTLLYQQEGWLALGVIAGVRCIIQHQLITGHRYMGRIHGVQPGPQTQRPLQWC